MNDPTPKRGRRRGRVHVVAGLFALACTGAAPRAGAQAHRPATAPPKVPPVAPPKVEVRPDADAEPDLAEPTAGGLTATQAGTRAASVSYQTSAASSLAEAADAREDQALSAFVPRIQGTGRYTRLSDFTPPPLLEAPPGLSLVGSPAPPGTPNPPSVAVPFPGTGFPVIVDQYLLQATVVIPVSDYFLRIAKAHTAASRGAEAARYDLAAARAKATADGKIAFYTWLKARGAEVVTRQVLAAAAGHLKDAQTQFTVGNASSADTLRAETTVAVAELAVQRAKSALTVAERQLRLAIQSGAEELRPGEGLDPAPPPLSGDLSAVVAEAQRMRPELKSLTKNAEAARAQASAQRAARLPSLSAFGDATYANPNARVFPQSARFFPTWAAGVQVVWSPSDALAGGAGGADYAARADALEAQAHAVRNGIELEATQAFQAVVDADVALGTTKRQLASAKEAHRVARQQYTNGQTTGTALSDAEAALAQARFDNLNARTDARIARVRLDYAAGRIADAR